MLHTRLRPYCKDFLEKISKMYELHVFTFGSRLYAHTIAGKPTLILVCIIALFRGFRISRLGLSPACVREVLLVM